MPGSAKAEGEVSHAASFAVTAQGFNGLTWLVRRFLGQALARGFQRTQSDLGWRMIYFPWMLRRTVANLKLLVFKC